MIDALYVVSGLLLPLFYLPQILRLLADQTDLASYSVSKAAIQLLLRMPALAFAVFTVDNDLMTLVLTLDLLGRAAEVAAAYRAMRRQGADVWTCMRRFLPAWSHMRGLYRACVRLGTLSRVRT